MNFFILKFDQPTLRQRLLAYLRKHCPALFRGPHTLGSTSGVMINNRSGHTPSETTTAEGVYLALWELFSDMNEIFAV